MVYNCSYLFSDFLSARIYVLLLVLGFGVFLYSFYSSSLLGENIKISILGLLLLIVGGTYNLTNLFLNGCVKDPYPFFNLFSFNFADVLINVGFVLLVYIYIKNFLITRGKKDA